jgi:hypothetical protein
MDEHSVSPHKVTQVLQQRSDGDNAALAEFKRVSLSLCSVALPVLDEHLRRRFAQFKLDTYFLETRGECFNLFLLLREILL